MYHHYRWFLLGFTLTSTAACAASAGRQSSNVPDGTTSAPPPDAGGGVGSATHTDSRASGEDARYTDGTTAAMGDAQDSSRTDASPEATSSSADICTGRIEDSCPSDLCQFDCCDDGRGGPECAVCCKPKECQMIDVAHCPLDRCQLMTDCGGRTVCYYRSSEPPPACGSVSYYGQEVACCGGLVKRCGAMINGVCRPDTGGYDGLPQCLACGDGTCDPIWENPCNCPEDCSG
jgi:hypothetical protein